MQLSDLIRNNPEAQRYFDSLPAYIQESLMQTGQEYGSLADLHARGEFLLCNHDSQS